MWTEVATSVSGFGRILYASLGTISLSFCASLTLSKSITVPLYFSGSSGMCICKSGVHGDKCDDCRPGFFNFSSTGCQPCRCNNHSSYCHPQSGEPPTCTHQKQQKKPEHCFPFSYHTEISVCRQLNLNLQKLHVIYLISHLTDAFIKVHLLQWQIPEPLEQFQIKCEINSDSSWIAPCQDLTSNVLPNQWYQLIYGHFLCRLHICRFSKIIR